MQFKSIKTKIVLGAALCIIILAASMLSLSLWSQQKSSTFVDEKVRSLIEESTGRSLLATAENQAGRLRAKLERNIDTARTLASAFKSIRSDDSIRHDLNLRKIFNDILVTTLKANPEFLGAYTAWMPNAIDGNDAFYRGKNIAGNDNDNGRFVSYWNRGSSGTIVQQTLVGYEDTSTHPNGVRKGGWFLNPRERGRENILDPFPYVVQGKTDWLTTMSAPIIINKQFLGIGGTDLRLDFVQSLAKKVAAKLYNGHALVRVISNMGIVVADSANPKNIGTPLEKTNSAYTSIIVEKIKAQKPYVHLGKNEKIVWALAPVELGDTGTPWAVIIGVPRNVVFADAIKLTDSLQEHSRTDFKIAISAGLGITLLACTLLWFLTGAIVAPIKKSVHFAESVANGDFEQKLDINQVDEVGVLANALKKMVENLKKMIVEAEEKSKAAEDEAQRANKAVEAANIAKEQASKAEKEGKLKAAAELEEIVSIVAPAMEQLSRQIEQSNSSAKSQYDQVSETSTAMEEMNSTVLEVAKNASSSAEAADMAKEKAQNGLDIVNNVLVSMEEVQSLAEQLKTDVTALGEDAEGIGQVMAVISDIADQTNLLALNAAIEAARAGDAGRGFAVVADEVRKLAEKTMAATKEVGDAVSKIQQGTQANIGHVGTAVGKINDTADL